MAEDSLGESTATLEFCQLLKFEVNRAARFLNAGWPLVTLVPRSLKIDIALFLHGGLAILNTIRPQDFDVLARRPTVGKWKKLQLLLAAWSSDRPAETTSGVSA